MAAHVLFCARRLPEQGMGGIERWSREVKRCLASRPATDLSHRGPRWAEPLYVAKLARRVRHAARRVPQPVVDASDASLAWPVSRTRLPAILRVHGLDLLYPNPVYQRLLRRGLPGIGTFIANSGPTAGLLGDLGVPDDRIRIIHPAVHAPASHEPRPRAGRILMLGRLVPRKGVDGFVRDEWPQIKDAWPEAHLDIVGDGPERKRVEDAAERVSDVHVHGALPQIHVEDLFRETDLFVMPNRHIEGDWEGFGMVAAEATIRGVPVVARAVDGIVDAVVEGVTGTLVDVDAGFAEAVVRAGKRKWKRGKVADEAEARFGRRRHDEAYLRAIDATRWRLTPARRSG